MYSYCFEPRIIDSENVEIGDPAYDVAYAYHMLKIFGAGMGKNLVERGAYDFVSEYLKHDQSVFQRLGFYKVVSGLVLTISVALDDCRNNKFKMFRENLLLRFTPGVRK